MGVESDWDFLLVLVGTAAAISSVVLVYAIVAWRRDRAVRAQTPADASDASPADRKPVFFRRYVPRE